MGGLCNYWILLAHYILFWENLRKVIIIYILLSLPHGCSTAQDFCFWPRDSFLCRFLRFADRTEPDVCLAEEAKLGVELVNWSTFGCLKSVAICIFFWLFKGFLLPNLIVGGCSGWWLWTPKWLQTLCLKKVHLRNVSKLSTGPEEIVKWSWQPGNMVVDSSLRHGSWYSRVLQKIRPGASSWGQIHCQCCCPEEVFKWFPDVYMTLKVDWGVVFQRVSWTSLVGVHVTPSNADVPPRKSLRLQVLVLGMDRQWILNAQWSTQRKAEVAGSPGGADVRARTGRDGLPPSNRAWRPGSRREQGRGASG